jgi:hypothetical protein
MSIRLLLLVVIRKLGKCPSRRVHLARPEHTGYARKMALGGFYGASQGHFRGQESGKAEILAKEIVLEQIRK